jgi:hypothetical protein
MEKIPCVHVLTNGKNKGDLCNKNNCKKHSGLPCNFILKNKKLCNRFHCKKHHSVLTKIVESIVDSIEYIESD